MPKDGYENIEQTKADMVRYFQHYNFERGHSYNDYLPLAVAEEGRITCKVAA